MKIDVIVIDHIFANRVGKYHMNMTADFFLFCQTFFKFFCERVNLMCITDQFLSSLSQTEYVIDRVKWLYDHRELVGGLKFVHEPKTLRFFTGRLEPVSDWPEKLLEAYIKDFGEDQ